VKTPQVVIGAGLGDEGKGHFVDYLASRTKDPVVIRFNGGAQAGHTVVTPDGKRHIFHHFGSGSLAGGKTYLSEFFVVNPMIFKHETKALRDLYAFELPAVDLNCIVTTPYDILINQIAETVRGDRRHGSCGLGFNETITRSLYSNDYKLTVIDLYNIDIKEKLDAIQKYWVPWRLGELGIPEFFDEMNDILTSENLKEQYLEDIEFFIKHSFMTDVYYLQGKNKIFEGAQGLMLDEDHANFPYVTRSKTGLDNVNVICDQLGIEDLQVHYLTRPYATRHGAGPLLHETFEPPYKNIVDKTNIDGPWQGKLRFGLLDVEILRDNIRRDYDRFRDSYDMSLSLVVNCFDHIDNGMAKYILNCEFFVEEDDLFLNTLDKEILPDLIYVSNGPTREHITLI
jgi:adenylosuccinate synthase